MADPLYTCRICGQAVQSDDVAVGRREAGTCFCRRCEARITGVELRVNRKLREQVEVIVAEYVKAGNPWP